VSPLRPGKVGTNQCGDLARLAAVGLAHVKAEPTTCDTPRSSRWTIRKTDIC
jgi:hypothetical protein